MAAEMHHFKTIDQGFISSSQSSFHCVNQSLDVDDLLPAHLVEETIQSPQARICAQCCGLRTLKPGEFLLVVPDANIRRLLPKGKFRRGIVSTSSKGIRNMALKKTFDVE
jgi:hypothetical protein